MHRVVFGMEHIHPTCAGPSGRSRTSCPRRNTSSITNIMFH